MCEIHFYHDETGKMLLGPSEEKNEKGKEYQVEVPRIIKAEHVNALGFQIMSSESARIPCISIRRAISRNEKVLESDPWNEDGRPPTLLTSILYPFVTFQYHCIEIVGFEDPNMVLAGLCRNPYRGRKPLPGATYVHPDMFDAVRYHPCQMRIREGPRHFPQQKIQLIGMPFHDDDQGGN